MTDAESEEEWAPTFEKHRAIAGSLEVIRQSPVEGPAADQATMRQGSRPTDRFHPTYAARVPQQHRAQ